jgi:DNA-binding transcriptional regulator YdaS (Cro superfamily)
MAKRLETLKRALSIVGSKKALCAALWISNEELNSCLEGKKPVPEPVYQVALEIVERDSTKE